MSLAGTGWGWAVAIVALGALFWIVRGMSPMKAWAVGLVSGLALFGISSEWARLFGSHAFVALLVPLTLYWSVAVLVASPARGPFQAVLLGPSALALSELVRSRFPLGGYGIAMISYTQLNGPLAPLASVVGSAGVSGLAAMAGVAGVALGLGAAGMLQRAGTERRLAAAVALPLLAVSSLSPMGLPPERSMPAGGTGSGPYGAAHGRSLRVAIVQVYDENRPLTEDEEAEGALLRWLEEGSMEATAFNPDLIVWPEGSLGSRVVGRSRVVDHAVRVTTSSSGASLLANGQPPTADLNHFVNRNYLFSPEGRLVNVSDKEKLVPFGEYVPWRSFLEPRIGSLSKIPIDGTPGRWSLLRVDGVGVGSLVCFESAFSEFVRGLVRSGSEVIIVETNNRSFGYSSLSRQHVAASRMRAIETKRYLVHAALSGISAIIGPDGSILQSAGLFERRVLVADLVPSGEMTPYVVAGDRAPAAAFTAFLLAGLLGVGRSLRRRSRE